MHDLCTSLKDSTSLCLGSLWNIYLLPCFRKLEARDRHLLEVSRAGSLRGLGGRELFEASLLTL